MTSRTLTETPTSFASADEPWPWRNHVEVVGRVATDPGVRTLATGQEVASARLVVPRVPEPDAGQRVDALDIVAVNARLRGRLMRLPPGAVVEVRGSLRRRFWHGPTGRISKWEIEIVDLVRLDRARGKTKAAG